MRLSISSLTLFAAILVFLAGASMTMAQPLKSAAEPQYYVEFHERKLGVHGGFMHVFIVIGRTMPNGTKEIVQTAGFYPDESGKKGLWGQGEVRTNEKTDASDSVFHALITEEQMRKATWIFKKWDEKKVYSLPFQNCVSMMGDVAIALGLKISEVYIPGGADPVTGTSPFTPYGLVERLSSFNKADTPLAHAAEKKTELQIKARAEQGKTMVRFQREVERKANLLPNDKETTLTNSNDRWELKVSPPPKFDVGMGVGPTSW